jgi:hypothetical protein
MPSEMPGVEYQPLNGETVMNAVLCTLLKGDFATTLCPAAQQRMYSELYRLCKDAGPEEEGSFIFLLQVAESFEEQINPRLPDWMAIQYKYQPQGVNLALTPESITYSHDISENDTLPNPETLPVFYFEWDEINWVAGYGILLGNEPLSLPDLN